MQSGPALRREAERLLPTVALRFALPVFLGVPLLLIGGSAIGTRLRETLELDAFAATAMLPFGIALTLVPAFYVGRVSRGT